MLKLFGALLIVLAGAMIGRLQAKKLSDRPGQIRRIVRILGQLETEIAYGFTPLPAALRKVAKQTAEPLSSLFEQIGSRLEQEEQAVMDVWQQTIYREWHRTAMKTAEKEVVIGLGYTLGTTDREDQIKHLRLAAKQLEGLELEAAEDQKKYEKVWRSLGLLGGALVAVIMY